MRKWLPLLLVLLAALGLGGWWWTQRTPAPLEYVVVRGDTLSKIAKRYEVSVDQLRAWNGIQGDLIEVDQVLLIHVSEPAEAPVQLSARGGRPRSSGGSSAPEPTPEEGPLVGLRMPTPEPCVPFDPELDDAGMAAPEGLGYRAIKGALDGVIQRALDCPHEGGGVWSPVFELQVGCDGVVSAVRLTESGGAPSEWSTCAAEVLRHADFPAHDIEGGQPVTYPVTVEY